MYTGLICPRLENCSHIWSASSYTSILGRVVSKAFCLISNPTLTLTLSSLTLQQKVASLSLFYRYYHGRCSRELVECAPQPLGDFEPLARQHHRMSWALLFLNPALAVLMTVSSQLSSVSGIIFLHLFSPNYCNLFLLKKQVCHHLRGLWDYMWFFYFFYIIFRLYLYWFYLFYFILFFISFIFFTSDFLVSKADMGL